MDYITIPAVTEAEAGLRLDQFLARHTEHSRTFLQQLITDKHVRIVNGDWITKTKTKVELGQVYRIAVPPPASPEILPENIPLDVLYEDDDLLVVNKSADMAVHPAPGNWTGTLVNALLHHCKGTLSGIGGVERPGLVHRLDLGTSGVMVVAKNDQAHRKLAKQFEKRTLTRHYKAFCYGIPAPREGEVIGNLGRSPQNRKKMTVLRDGGKHAHTLYRVDQTFHGCVSLIDLKLMTGRTHQIRVHMAHIGHGLLGDPVYGRPRKLDVSEEAKNYISSLQHQALHAYILGFIHPTSGEYVEFSAEFPPALQKLRTLLS